MFCKKGGSFDAGLDRCLKGYYGLAVATCLAPFTSPLSRTSFIVLLTGWLVGALAYSFYEARGRRFSLAEYARFAAGVDLQEPVVRGRRPAALLQPAAGSGAMAGRRAFVTVVAQLGATQLVTLFGERAGVEPGISTAALVVLMLLARLRHLPDAPPVTRRAVPVVVPPGASFRGNAESADLLRKHPVYDAFSVLIDCLAVAPCRP